MGGAAFELFSVAKACVIDNYFVAELCGSVGDVYNFRVFLKDSIDLLLNVLFGNNVVFQIGLEAAINKAHKNLPVLSIIFAKMRIQKC